MILAVSVHVCFDCMSVHCACDFATETCLVLTGCYFVSLYCSHQHDSV